jgi:DNA-binding transcriptional ArsR family regulator
VIAGDADAASASIAAAIGVPARARMLYRLLDGRARTGTELAVAAGVTASTASIHLQKLRVLRLVRVVSQGRHRYYSLEGATVAAALEALSVVAGGPLTAFAPRTPHPLRAARTCYDHLAGTLGVLLHDRLRRLGFLVGPRRDESYGVTPAGQKALEALGIDVARTFRERRRFAFACIDWSERRPHLGGALGAALLDLALERKWVARDLGSRAVSLTPVGRRALETRLGVVVPPIRALGPEAAPPRAGYRGKG